MAGLVRWTGMMHLPFDDEMFHVLAAHSWSVDGSLRVLDGVYTRASGFTILIGLLFRLWGESLFIARLPAFVTGVTWVLGIFLWVRAVAGRRAAWISAGLFCFAPHAIELSQLSRFYTLHGLAFWLGATTWFTLFTRQWAVRTAVSMVGCTCLGLGVAVYLQPTTYIGLTALALWTLWELGRRWRELQEPRVKRLWLLAGGIGLAGLGGLVVLVLQSPDLFLQCYRVMALYTRAAYWNVGHDVFSYHRFFLEQYPLFWTLMPLALLGGIAMQPRAGGFCACMFTVSLLLHSAAGLKEERYIYYTMPFFFSIWGMVLARLWPHLRRLMVTIIEQAMATTRFLPAHPVFKKVCQLSVLGIIVFFFCVSNGAFPRLFHTLRGQSYYFGLQQSDWAAARERLLPYVQDAAVMLTTNFTKATYYLGRLDFTLNKSFLQENGFAEFTRDHRNGRPVVSSIDSLRLIFSCFPTGIFVGEAREWRFGGRMDAATADFLEASAVPLELPKHWHLVAFTWERPPGPPSPQCASVPGTSLTAISMHTPAVIP
jgi:hypothetical protein